MRPSYPFSQPRESGLTIVEILVVLAVAGLAAAIGWPALERTLVRAKLEGTTLSVATFLHQARSTAVRRGVPVVVRFDSTTEIHELVAFADVHTAAGVRGSDLIYNPDTSIDPDTGVPRPEWATDHEVAHLPLPATGARHSELMVYPWSVDDAAPDVRGAVSGFTPNPDGGPSLAVFLPDGSIRDTGAYRLGLGPLPYGGDWRADFFEVRVAPQATARIELRKYIFDGDVERLAAGYYPRSVLSRGGWKWYH